MLKNESGEERVGTLVQYARFLEVRERRQRIVADLTLSTRRRAARPGLLPTIDCETSSDPTGDSPERAAAMVAPACSTEGTRKVDNQL